MSRRSDRLQEAHYYTEQGSPSVSYKERLYKVFRRRTCYEKSDQRRNIRNNYEQHGDCITPDYHQLDDRQDVDNHDSISMNRNNADPSTSTSTAQIRTPQILTPETQAARTTTPQIQTLTAETQVTHTWTSGAEAISTATTGTQTTRPKRKKVETKGGYSFHFGFLSLLLMALAFTHTQLQMAELKRDVQSLRQRLDTVSPLADNMPNFALESLGASVMPTLSSETYCPDNKGMSSICSTLYRSKRQINVIQGHSSLYPGECWSFSGAQGHLLITLSHPVSVTHVTLGHITKSQSPNGFIASAPREFSVYGLKTTEEEGTCLGKLVYDQDGAAFQTFQLTNPDNGVFRHVKLQIENNWGNKDYTCLYNVRVHGNLPTSDNYDLT